MPSQWVHTRQGQGTTHRYDTWDLHIYVAFTSRKTKPKVITLASRKAHRKSKLELLVADEKHGKICASESQLVLCLLPIG